MDRTILTTAKGETMIRTSDAEACWVVYSDSPAMLRQLQVLAPGYMAERPAVQEVGGEDTSNEEQSPWKRR